MKRVACILALITFFTAFAQDIEDIPVVELEQDTTIAVIDTILEPVPDFTAWTYTADDIKRMPVTTVNDILILQPGIVESEAGLHLRGGGADEIGYYVDGIQTSIPMPLSAIDRLHVLPNPTDAEYGNALAGVVDITTKKLTSRPTGTFRYVNDNPFSNEDTERRYDRYEACFQGLLAPYASFTVAGNMTNTDAFQQALYKVPSPREDYTLFGSVTLQVTKDRGYITLSGARSRDQYVVWTPYTEPGNNLKYFDQRPMSRTKRSLVAVSFDLHPFSKTDFSVNIGVNKSESVYGNRDYLREDSLGRAWYDDYRLKDERFIDYLINGELPIMDILVDSLSFYHEEWSRDDQDSLRLAPYVHNPYFYIAGFYPEWKYNITTDKQIHAKIIHTLSPWHDARVGFDYVKYNIKHYSSNYEVNIPAPWTLIDTVWDFYERTPHEYGIYLHNLIHSKHFTTDLGVRYDYFQPNAFTFASPQDDQDTTLMTAEPKTALSPRVAISILPTPYLYVWTQYGHYTQMPSFEELYSSTDVEVIREALEWSRLNYVVGNINLEPIKTHIFEIGATYENPYNIKIVGLYYHKDLIGNPGVTHIYGYQYDNVDTLWVAGFEFHIEKPLTDICSFGFALTHQMARTIDQIRLVHIRDHFWWSNHISGPRIFKPDYDAWLSMKGHIDFTSPADVQVTLIKDFSTSLSVVYHSGLPYSPMGRYPVPLDYNSLRMPHYWNMDLKISKGIRIGPTKLVVTALLMNLFDSVEIVDVYNNTGLPDDHGDEDPLLGQFSYAPIGSDYYSPQADFDHDGLITPYEFRDDYIAARDDYYDDPTNWKNPFRFLLGVGIEF